MIRIVEVGPRDGLQNESVDLSVSVRVQMIQKLLDVGIKTVEVGSFVSPQKVPQMAKSKDVFKKVIQANPRAHFPVLVPNERGMREALSVGVREVAIFTAASESFNQANINCSIQESFKRFAPVLKMARSKKIKVRGYLSTCFYCPYEGKIQPSKVIRLTKKLLSLGCYEVSIGDTIGAATPKEVTRVLEGLKSEIKKNQIAMHFHDTRGTALANIVESLRLGVKTFDSSIGGLGGCPFAPGAQGNVATEDVVYLLHGMGLKTGVNLGKLLQINSWLSKKMGKKLVSRVGNAKLPKI